MFGAVSTFLGMKESATRKLAREKDEKKLRRREEKRHMMEMARHIPQTDLLGNVLTEGAGVPPAPQVHEQAFTVELHDENTDDDDSSEEEEEEEEAGAGGPTAQTGAGRAESDSSSSSSSSSTDSGTDTDTDDSQGHCGSVKGFSWDLYRGRQPCLLSRVLEKFYARYNPERVANIAAILRGYEGDEQVMLRQLSERYAMTQADMQFFVDFGYEAQGEGEDGGSGGHNDNGTARPGSILKRAGQGSGSDESRRRVSISESSNTSHNLRPSPGSEGSGSDGASSDSESDPESDPEAEPASGSGSESEPESDGDGRHSSVAPPRPPPPPAPSSARPSPPPRPPSSASAGDSESEPESSDPESESGDTFDGSAAAAGRGAPSPPVALGTEALLRKKIRTNMPSAANHYANAIEANSSFIYKRRATKMERREKREKKASVALAPPASPGSASGKPDSEEATSAKEERKAAKLAAKEQKKAAKATAKEVAILQKLQVKSEKATKKATARAAKLAEKEKKKEMDMEKSKKKSGQREQESRGRCKSPGKDSAGTAKKSGAKSKSRSPSASSARSARAKEEYIADSYHKQFPHGHGHGHGHGHSHGHRHEHGHSGKRLLVAPEVAALNRITFDEKARAAAPTPLSPEPSAAHAHAAAAMSPLSVARSDDGDGSVASQVSLLRQELQKTQQALALVVSSKGGSIDVEAMLSILGMQPPVTPASVPASASAKEADEVSVETKDSHTEGPAQKPGAKQTAGSFLRSTQAEAAAAKPAKPSKPAKPVKRTNPSSAGSSANTNTIDSASKAVGDAASLADGVSVQELNDPGAPRQALKEEEALPEASATDDDAAAATTTTTTTEPGDDSSDEEDEDGRDSDDRTVVSMPPAEEPPQQRTAVEMPPDMSPVKSSISASMRALEARQGIDSVVGAAESASAEREGESLPAKVPSRLVHEVVNDSITQRTQQQSRRGSSSANRAHADKLLSSVSKRYNGDNGNNGEVNGASASAGASKKDKAAEEQAKTDFREMHPEDPVAAMFGYDGPDGLTEGDAAHMEVLMQNRSFRNPQGNNSTKNNNSDDNLAEILGKADAAGSVGGSRPSKSSSAGTGKASMSKASMSPVGPVDDDWMQCYDPRIGRVYFHSKSRGNSSWVVPFAAAERGVANGVLHHRPVPLPSEASGDMDPPHAGGGGASAGASTITSQMHHGLGADDGATVASSSNRSRASSNEGRSTASLRQPLQDAAGGIARTRDYRLRDGSPSLFNARQRATSPQVSVNTSDTGAFANFEMAHQLTARDRASHMFSPKVAHMEHLQQSRQEHERALAEKRIVLMEQVPEVGSAYSEEQRQYQLHHERSKYLQKFESVREHSPASSPYLHNHPQRHKRLGGARSESPSHSNFAQTLRSRDSSPAASVWGGHGYASPVSTPGYMQHHPALRGGQRSTEGGIVDYTNNTAAGLKAAYRNASPRMQQGFQSAQRAANMHMHSGSNSRSGTPDSRSEYSAHTSDSHSCTQSQNSQVQHQRPFLSGSVAAPTPDTNVPVILRNQPKFQHRNNAPDSPGPGHFRGRDPSPDASSNSSRTGGFDYSFADQRGGPASSKNMHWQGSTGGMVSTPNREYTARHRSPSPQSQFAPGGVCGARRGTQQNIQGHDVNDIGEVSPWQECYTSSGKRYFYNCFTGQSTYRAPAPPSSAELR